MEDSNHSDQDSKSKLQLQSKNADSPMDHSSQETDPFALLHDNFIEKTKEGVLAERASILNLID